MRSNKGLGCVGLLAIAGVYFVTVANTPELHAVADTTSSTSSSTSSSTTTTTLPDVNTPRLTKIGTPPELIPVFIDAGTRRGIDPVILAAQVKAESGFQNHACRIVHTAVARDEICGIAQLGQGWGPRAQRLDVTWAINRQSDGIKVFLDSNGGDVNAAWRRYMSGDSTQGGDCGNDCAQYVRNINTYIAEANA